jgi:hypothetical protein
MIVLRGVRHDDVWCEAEVVDLDVVGVCANDKSPQPHHQVLVVRR